MKPKLHLARPLAVALALALAACSGGVTTTAIPNANTASASTYNGPAPGTADVQAFKVNLWQYIDTPNRCGNCHKAGGQTPMFARSDDVNLAYNDALTVVNLAQPDQSMMVLKVARWPQLLALEPAGLRRHPDDLDQELGRRRRGGARRRSSSRRRPTSRSAAPRPSRPAPPTTAALRSHRPSTRC